jgi:hypothetical protein
MTTWREIPRDSKVIQEIQRIQRRGGLGKKIVRDDVPVSAPTTGWTNRGILALEQEKKRRKEELERLSRERAEQTRIQDAERLERVIQEEQARVEALGTDAPKIPAGLITPGQLETYQVAAQHVAAVNPQYTTAQVAQAAAAVAAQHVAQGDLPQEGPEAPAAPAVGTATGVVGAGLAAVGAWLLFGG